MYKIELDDDLLTLVDEDAHGCDGFVFDATRRWDAVETLLAYLRVRLFRWRRRGRSPGRPHWELAGAAARVASAMALPICPSILR